MPSAPKTSPKDAERVAASVARRVGQRLRQAREQARMSQQDLAQTLGYAPSLISAYESGSRRLKVDDLARLCALFDKSADYFLRAETATGVRVGVKLRAQLAGFPSSSSTEAVNSFLDYAELELARTRPLPNLRNKEPEPAARSVLRTAGLSEPPVDMDDITEALGLPVIVWPFPDSLSALIADTDEGGCVIGVNRWHPQTRRRFSVAHECGHAVLGHAADFYLEFTDVNPFGDPARARYREEREANQFAAALLMDSRWLASDYRAGLTDAATLAARYRVSEEAMSYRLSNLGLS